MNEEISNKKEELEEPAPGATVEEQENAEAAEPAQESKADEATPSEPEAADAAEEPEAEDAAEEPVAEEAVEETEAAEAVEETAEEPVAEKAPEEPEAEMTAEEPEPEEAVEAPEAEEPQAEEAVEEPASEEAPEESEEGEAAEEPDATAEAAAEEAPAAAAAQEKAEAEEKASKKRWYVVHTYSGRENKVRETIERMIKNSDMSKQFGKVLVATEEVAEMKKGKKKVSQRKLFPSYILIEMEMTDEAWAMIENIPGVTHFVGEGKKPFPIPKKEVDRILGRMTKKEGVVPEVPFTLGEHVRVIDGPFADFTGIVDEINPERGKMKVLVSIFGRETPVELDFLQVKAI